MTMKYKIEIETNPKTETIQQIRNSLIAHNRENSSIADGKNLAIKAVSDLGMIVGGVVAWQWGGCIEIEYLWVSENVRGEKLGTKLLKQLEYLLSEHSSKVIITTTFSFQAPEFYLKNGFEIIDEVAGYPHNVKKYFLKKAVNR